MQLSELLMQWPALRLNHLRAMPRHVCDGCNTEGLLPRIAVALRCASITPRAMQACLRWVQLGGPACPSCSFATAPRPECQSDLLRSLQAMAPMNWAMSGLMQQTMATKSVAPGLMRSLRLRLFHGCETAVGKRGVLPSPASGNRVS